MKTELETLAAKIRARLSAINGFITDIASIQRQQAEAQKIVDDLIADGAADDEKAVARVSTAQARLLFFPAKLKHAEDDFAKERETLAVDILAAQLLLGRAATFVEKRLKDEIEALLAPRISDTELRDVAVRTVVNACDARLQSNRAVTNYYEAQVKGAELDRLVQYATIAANNLEAIS